MKKIDNSLKNAYILCDDKNEEMCLVYYTNEQKMHKYLKTNNIFKIKYI